MSLMNKYNREQNSIKLYYVEGITSSSARMSFLRQKGTKKTEPPFLTQRKKKKLDDLYDASAF